MAFDVELSFSNTTGNGLLGATKAFRSRVQNRLLRTVSEHLAETARNRITTTKRDPFGRLWKPRKRKGPGSLLFVTHKLKDSIKFFRDNTGWRIVATDPKAAFHQLGTRKMVARPFLGFSMPEINRVIDEWIRGGQR